MSLSTVFSCACDDSLLERFTERDIFGSLKTPEILRRRIALLMDQNGTKQLKFATVVGRKPSWVSMFLRGDRPFPLDSIDDVAKFYHCSVEALLAPLDPQEVKRSNELLRSFRSATVLKVDRA